MLKPPIPKNSVLLSASAHQTHSCPLVMDTSDVFYILFIIYNCAHNVTSLSLRAEALRGRERRWSKETREIRGSFFHSSLCILSYVSIRAWKPPSAYARHKVWSCQPDFVPGSLFFGFYRGVGYASLFLTLRLLISLQQVSSHKTKSPAKWLLIPGPVLPSQGL